jgi:hypothetical protein
MAWLLLQKNPLYASGFFVGQVPDLQPVPGSVVLGQLIENRGVFQS